ncbi:MAG: hypothetical protein WKF77_15560 [Planctomycetaceae bacterium]
MSATAVKREVAVIFGYIVPVIVVSSRLLLLDSYNGVHEFLERCVPGFGGAYFTFFGQDGQRCIVTTVV